MVSPMNAISRKALQKRTRLMHERGLAFAPALNGMLGVNASVENYAMCYRGGNRLGNNWEKTAATG